MSDIEFLATNASQYRDSHIALKQLVSAIKRRERRNDSEAIFKLNKAKREADKVLNGITEPRPFKSLMEQLRDGELWEKK